MNGIVRLTTAVAMVACAAPAWAANTTAANARFLMPGEKQTDTLDGSTTSRWYKTNLVAGRSYAVYVWAPDAEASVVAPDLNEVAFFTDEGSTAATTVTAADQEVDLDVPTGFNQAQTKIIPTSSGAHWLQVSTATVPGASYEIKVLLVETTLFSPWWFVSTPNGYDGFIEIRNNATQSVDVTVTAYADTGSVTGTPQVRTIAGNGTALVQVGGTMGAPDGFGSAQISHTGPPGAVSANITTLSAMTGLSFDAPFAPRQGWAQLGAN